MRMKTILTVIWPPVDMVGSQAYRNYGFSVVLFNEHKDTEAKLRLASTSKLLTTYMLCFEEARSPTCLPDILFVVCAAWGPVGTPASEQMLSLADITVRGQELHQTNHLEKKITTYVPKMFFSFPKLP